MLLYFRGKDKEVKQNKYNIKIYFIKVIPYSSFKHQVTCNHQVNTSTSGKIVTKITKVLNYFSDRKQFELKRYHIWS